MKILGFLLFVTPFAFAFAMTGEGYPIPFWIRLICSYLVLIGVSLCLFAGIYLLVFS